MKEKLVEFREWLRAFLAVSTFLFCLVWGAYSGLVMAVAITNNSRQGDPILYVMAGILFGLLGGGWVGAKIVNPFWLPPDENQL